MKIIKNSNGNIAAQLDANGTFTINGAKFHIESEDYDAGITASGSLDNNAGTVLTLSGFANGEGSNTNYKPVIRNVGTPHNDYDVANKKYVDDNIVIPVYHLVELNNDGSVNIKASTLTYANVSANLTNPRKADYLDVIWETIAGSGEYTRFHVPCVGIEEVNSGNLIFSANIYFNQTLVSTTFTLDNQDTLTTVAIIPTPEAVINKVQSVVSNSTSTAKYPSTKAVFDEFQRKPVTVWENTQGSGLLAIGADITETPSWQLTNLDLTPYKRVKIYTKASQKSSGVGVNASYTPAVVLEMSLDSRAAGPIGGHYVGSYMGQKPNDANRLFTVTCAISADKTSFVVLRMSTLYGTAATDNADCNGYVFMIEGYYD